MEAVTVSDTGFGPDRQNFEGVLHRYGQDQKRNEFWSEDKKFGSRLVKFEMPVETPT